MEDQAEYEVVNRFWLDEVGPPGWYAQDAELDGRIREMFRDYWERARNGGLRSWLGRARGTLAYILVTDQFPRNMFREDFRAYATDGLARAAAERAVCAQMDIAIPEPQRQFFYLPFMHSESQSDQDRCVRLMVMRLAETGADNLLHARAHRAVIRRFGRFPHRNEALERATGSSESAFLADGGYGAVLRALRGETRAA